MGDIKINVELQPGYIDEEREPDLWDEDERSSHDPILGDAKLPFHDEYYCYSAAGEIADGKDSQIDLYIEVNVMTRQQFGRPVRPRMGRLSA